MSGPASHPQFGAATRDVAIGAIETVKALLLVPGADVNVQTTPGKETVMHLLARTQGAAVLPLVNQMLANCGGLDLGIVNAEGKTCLEVAAETRMGNGVESAVRIHLNNQRLGMGTFRQ